MTRREAISISDLIVVMKDGLLQQIGKPQEVYDNPQNLFVAKFLGTPPSVFSGRNPQRRSSVSAAYRCFQCPGGGW